MLRLVITGPALPGVAFEGVGNTPVQALSSLECEIQHAYDHFYFDSGYVDMVELFETLLDVMETEKARTFKHRGSPTTSHFDIAVCWLKGSSGIRRKRRRSRNQHVVQSVTREL